MNLFTQTKTEEPNADVLTMSLAELQIEREAKYAEDQRCRAVFNDAIRQLNQRRDELKQLWVLQQSYVFDTFWADPAHKPPAEYSTSYPTPAEIQAEAEALNDEWTKLHSDWVENYRVIEDRQVALSARIKQAEAEQVERTRNHWKRVHQQRRAAVR